jgi:two-component system nitrogen regulation sensor histidine kinase NtrY
LTGVSAGVIGLDRDGCINLPNRTASALLGVDLDRCMGEDLMLVVPEMSELLEQAWLRPDRLAQGQVQIAGANSSRTLLVRIAAEHDEGEVTGFVVTFDDITELVSAQRKAAWADIARRIAHEIKNPLTPIQLSAERLKRRYLKDITKDPETFKICTDTIIRHVEDIGRMVDEFSSFARMPQPVLKPEDVATIVEQAVFLERTAHPKITFDMRFPARPIPLRCDARLVSQALINIIKNAVESIDGRIVESGPIPAGRISVTVEASDHVTVTVEDNGKGLPAQGRERLTEPYVTTRAKGTGLGLAIVKKIMEDHGGELMLADAPQSGAYVQLIFAHEPRPVAGRSVSSEAPAVVIAETSQDVSEAPEQVAEELSSVSHGA